MARLTPALRRQTARVLALAAVASAVGLGLCAQDRLERRPRTHDAYLFADSIGITPEVSGRIVSLPVRENQRVARGDVLIEIEREPFELRLLQARAQLAALQAQIALTTRQVAAQSSGAAAAGTQVVRASSQLELAHDTVERLSPLLDKGYVTVQLLDEARHNENIARAALLAARQQADQARQAVGDTESLQAQLAGAEAAVGLAERDLRNTTLRAPFAGFVVGREIADGAFVSAGHPVFTLIDATDWYAVGVFRETDLPQIHVGDSATVWLVGDDNRSLSGRVESVGYGVRPEVAGGPGLPPVGRTLNWVVIAQRFPVRIRLDAVPEESRRIGATVSVLVKHERG